MSTLNKNLININEQGQSTRLFFVGKTGHARDFFMELFPEKRIKAKHSFKQPTLLNTKQL